jgi:hypothetical protein
VQIKLTSGHGFWLAIGLPVAIVSAGLVVDFSETSEPLGSGVLSNSQVPTELVTRGFEAIERPDEHTTRKKISENTSSKSTLPGADSPRLLIFRIQSIVEAGALEESRWAEIQSILSELRTGGVAVVSDIVDFLVSKEDAELFPDAGQAGKHLTLRLALIRLLGELGGFESQLALLDLVNSPLSAFELEAACNALESLQPGYYRDIILASTEYKLEEVFRDPSLHVAEDTAPLFRLLQNYGDERVINLLALAPRWQRAYADIALANLPEGVGITSLAIQARRELGRSDESRSLHLLAQAAVSESQAERALLELVRDGLVPETCWPLIASVFMGDNQLQIQNPEMFGRSVGSLLNDRPVSMHTFVERNTQTIFRVDYSAHLQPSERAARIDLILRFLNEAYSPGANEALWNVYQLLVGHRVDIYGGTN